MAPRLSGQNCKFFKFLLSLNSQRRLAYKENNSKYRSLTWKPRSHVRILIYRTSFAFFTHISTISRRKFISVILVLRSVRPSYGTFSLMVFYSPVPELSFLPAQYRGWTQAGERRVQDNLHAHAQNSAIFSPQIGGKKTYLEVFSRFGLWRNFLYSNNFCIQID